MNQSVQVSSQDDKNEKPLAAREFTYEFFQPTFDSQLNYEFSAGGPANLLPVKETAQAVPDQMSAAPALSVSPDQSVIAVATVFTAAPAELVAPIVPVVPVVPVAPVAPVISISTPVRSIEKQAADNSGAIIYYGKWNLKPHRIRYADRSVAEFEYDELERLIRVKDRDGTEWLRITQPDHKNIATWKAADDQTCEMSMVVIPDGTYQCTNAAGVIQTCTLSGRIVVWTPFTDGFDLKRTLFSIFRRIDKNQDSSLSKEELEIASRQIWEDSDAVQLISMLQTHYEAICACRPHALCRQGSGITIEDILAFDKATAEEHDSRTNAPPHAVSLVKALFDELDQVREGAVTINQIRIAYDKRFEKDCVSQKILQIMYEDIRDKRAGASGFGTNNLTRSDLVEHFQNAYREEIRGQIKIAGWGTDECWQTGEVTTRTLYVDQSKPLESILSQAIKRKVADPTISHFMAIFESLIVQCPHIVLRMINQTEDGKYDVRFPGAPHRSFVVETPKSNTLSLYVHGANFGFWMAVIEDAYRQYDAQYIGTDRDHSSMVERITLLLTGQRGSWVDVKSMQLSDLAHFMRDAFKQRRVMVGTGINDGPRVADSRLISRNSVCGIINFDFKSNRVMVNDTLRDCAPGSQTDPANYNTDGSVTLSTSTFSNAFDRLYVEDWLQLDDVLQK